MKIKQATPEQIVAFLTGQNDNNPITGYDVMTDLTDAMINAAERNAAKNAKIERLTVELADVRADAVLLRDEIKRLRAELTQAQAQLRRTRGR